jgi:hypothetical protein
MVPLSGRTIWLGGFYVLYVSRFDFMKIIYQSSQITQTRVEKAEQDCTMYCTRDEFLFNKRNQLSLHTELCDLVRNYCLGKSLGVLFCQQDFGAKSK